MRVTLVSPLGVEVDAPEGELADALLGAGYTKKKAGGAAKKPAATTARAPRKTAAKKA
jgi:hypothetical protein